MSRHWIGREDGAAGLEWWFELNPNEMRIYIAGTDHRQDWLHHTDVRRIEAAKGVWVSRADLRVAAAIISAAVQANRRVIIGGHSWGGAIAALAVWSLRLRGIEACGILYGPKQAGNAQFVADTAPYTTAYRHRGDVVPFLLFWLARFNTVKIGRLTWPWVAHQPRAYYQQMEVDGFR